MGPLFSIIFLSFFILPFFHTTTAQYFQMKSLRKFVGCEHHHTRYKALISWHIIDAITFIIRFLLVSHDIFKSKQASVNFAYPVIILFLELIGTAPFFCINILYCIMKCFKNECFRDDENPVCCRRRKALRVATLTCLPCHCYQDHPQGMQLTRVVIFTCCYIFRCIAVKLGVSCSEIFKPRCVSYTFISKLALVLSFFTMFVEWCHFHHLWHYRPNIPSISTQHRARSHLRFMPNNLINHERTRSWNDSLCEYQHQCNSNSLHHALLYHSIRGNADTPLAPVQDNQRIIAYYVTTTKNAIEIAQYGFPVNRERRLKSDIVFMRTVETWNDGETENNTAIICARLNLGHVSNVETRDEFDFDAHINQTRTLQTIQLLPDGYIKVRFPGQIENWIISIQADDDKSFSSHYDGCI